VDGLEKKEVISKFRERGAHEDFSLLYGESGRCWGASFASSIHDITNPIFISVGTGISLSTAIELTRKCCHHRIPEPIRHADIGSRKFVRDHLLTDGSTSDPDAQTE
jgi:deoxyinosine 3'endonuclease (endonuclease V)